MCGICGFVGKPDDNLINGMCNKLVHRGPDSGGKYTDKGICLGIRRLKIIDLKTGDQPIYNEDKTVVIVFNGEIYNFKELRENLEKSKHRFYTQSDTEVIVHLYEDYKENCVNFLRGMFSFAIWDRNEKKLIIARDRLGEKPLYYTFANNRFLFASELKAILEDRSVSREINLEALDYYLRFLYIPAPLTIFKGIYKLPAAHWLIWQDGQIRTERYWELQLRPKKYLPSEAYAEQIRYLLKEVIGLRLVSDVPLGVFLSGGIDSSTIVAMMRQISSSKIKTFSIGYDKEYKDYNELQYSRLLSDHFGTEHQEFIINPEIIKLLPKIVWHLDEPFADSSAILTYLISYEAKKYVTVALSGIGGDEVFGGYPRYMGAQLSLYYEKLPLFLRYGLSKFKSRDARGRIKRFLHEGVLPKGERYIRWLSVFTDETLESLYTDFFKEGLQGSKELSIHKHYFDQTIAESYLDRILYLDVNTYLVDDLLFMGDRMSMANSLELRVPFADHKLIEFSASIPYQQKIEGLKLKSLLKKSLKGILPEEILHKRKQGFMVPIGEWFRGQLRNYVQEVLSSENIKKRGYFNPAFVRQMLNEHFERKKTYTHHVWALVMFELWMRRFIDES